MIADRLRRYVAKPTDKSEMLNFIGFLQELEKVRLPEELQHEIGVVLIICDSDNCTMAAVGEAIGVVMNPKVRGLCKAFLALAKHLIKEAQQMLVEHTADDALVQPLQFVRHGRHAGVRQCNGRRMAPLRQTRHRSYVTSCLCRKSSLEGS